MNAYDFYLQALAQVNLSNARAAFPLLSQARALAPDFAPAFGLETWCRTLWSYSAEVSDFAENSRIAIELARKALTIGDDDPELLGQIGYTLAYFEENVELGLDLVRQALEAAPSLAWLWVSQGLLHNYFGDCADAVTAFDPATLSRIATTSGSAVRSCCSVTMNPRFGRRRTPMSRPAKTWQ